MNDVQPALLPRNLQALASLCRKDEGRFALTGVRLLTTETGYRVYQWNGSQATLVATLAKNVTTYQVNNLPAATTRVCPFSRSQATRRPGMGSVSARSLTGSVT